MSKAKSRFSDVFAQCAFAVKEESSTLKIFYIQVCQTLVEQVRQHLIDLCRQKMSAKGFGHDVPLHYIENNLVGGILDSCKRFIYKYFVLDFLDYQIEKHNLACATNPRFKEVEVLSDGSMKYTFKASCVPLLSEQNWFANQFMPPRRKLYKDLDRQADLFVRSVLEERSKILAKQKSSVLFVESGDWVSFSVAFVNSERSPIFKEWHTTCWLNVNTKYIVCNLHQNFIDKKIGDTFYVTDFPLYGMPTDFISIKGMVKIVITGIFKASQFDLGLFKSMFDLKSDKEMHEKFIEIFSFRNDISQRRLIIEEAFRVMLNRFKFEVPKYLILRRQENLIKLIKLLPDYNVYKMSEKFSVHVAALAERQLKEEVLVQQIAAKEKITVTQANFFEYLNLYCHSRMAEFVYFKLTMDSENGIPVPLREGYFRQFVLKEKVLNYMIKRLSS